MRHPTDLQNTPLWNDKGTERPLAAFLFKGHDFGHVAIPLPDLPYQKFEACRDCIEGGGYAHCKACLDTGFIPALQAYRVGDGGFKLMNLYICLLRKYGVTGVQLRRTSSTEYACRFFVPETEIEGRLMPATTIDALDPGAESPS